MEITASMVMELRAATGLGMMDCKKALAEANGNMEVAIDSLRKKGQATAAKRADKEAKEGKVSIASDATATVVYETNSETDFVSRNDDFVYYTKAIGEILLANKPSDLEAALAIKSDKFGGMSIQEKTLELVGKIGEKISLSRFAIVSPKFGEKLFSYVHGDGKIGVLVLLSSDKADALNSLATEELGKDLAMQIAAAKPLSVDKSGVPADFIAKEREISLEQVKNSGKPEAMWEKIVDGKMSKLYKQVVLLEQEFIKNPDITVEAKINDVAKAVGAQLKVLSFVRYELGVKGN